MTTIFRCDSRAIDSREALHHLVHSSAVGAENMDNSQNLQILMRHMLRPFTHRRSDAANL